MYKKVSDNENASRKYETEETSEQVLGRTLKWRKGADGDVIHTVERLGYDEPLKDRVSYETLVCGDGQELYRITVDDTPLLYSDEKEYGGWMTYHQMLCFIEGYKRLSETDDFVQTAEEK